MTEDDMSISVESCLAVCKPLSNLLKSSFGPNALHVLYTSTSGKVLLTSDGSTILGAMHISHPIGRCLIDRVIKFHSYAGDHAKSYVFLVTSILEGIAHELDSSAKSFNRKSVKGLNQQNIVLKLNTTLTDVLRDIFPGKVLPALVQQSFPVTSRWDKESCWTLLSSLIHTHLCSNLTPKQAKFMTNLLEVFMKGYANTASDQPYIRFLQSSLINLLDNFQSTCLAVAGVPIENSHIVDGIIISRDVVSFRDEHFSGTCTTFAILGFNLMKDSTECQATISSRTVGDLLFNMQHTRRRLTCFVTQLVNAEVTVLLSPECLSQPLLSLLQKSGITVIHTIPNDEIERISLASKVNVIYEISGCLESSYIGFAREVKTVTFGKKRFIQITLDKTTGTKHLILCAPSEGACRMLSQAISNSMKYVKCFLETNKEVPRDIRGMLSSQLVDASHLLISAGGAAELIASDILDQEHVVYKDNWYLSVVFKIIAKALLCIPRTIHQNSFSGNCDNSSSFLKILNARKCRSESEQALGIDGRNGELCIPSDKGAVESVSSKYLLWVQTIETVCDLLKMDMIIPVSRIPLRTVDSDEEEDDC